ncbi:YgaP-like transmembrane domain [Alkalihalobacillus sp. CinArs1]|uniref:YgaP-like transmembrane domain n=1 Tax=Alkalihalobacillus sp. CinArs1 TaxID=2995314 RepID=UPI0022DDF53E|nr:YgaP-like transmembrane domain [Alkalihalobacillus sp. CinArs1]
MRPNISMMNAFIRLTAGFTLLSWSTAKLCKNENVSTSLLLAAAGALMIAEGHTRYCPIVDLMNQDENRDPDETALEKVINPS